MNKIITQIGSLPYDNIEDAINYSLMHDIPFLPELPLLGDLCMDYIRNPGKLSCLERFSRIKFDIVKVQGIGPATLVCEGYNEDEAVRRSTEHLTKIIDQIKAREIIMFLDEPSLEMVSFDYKKNGLSAEECKEAGIICVDYQKLWEKIFESLNSKRRNLTYGVHCCSNMDWDKLFENENISIISFDASKYAKRVISSTKYRSSKRISWGINSEKDMLDFQSGDIITLPCGMSPASYKPEDCVKNLNKLEYVRKQML